jgi:large subunit ribosomal protein L22
MAEQSEQPLYRAVVKNVHVSPRKARLVVDLIRGKNVVLALGILDSTAKKSSPIVKNLLKSAIANAEQHDENVDVDSLIVKRAFVDGGTTLRRWRPRAMGRGTPIRKRTSHITLLVG